MPDRVLVTNDPVSFVDPIGLAALIINAGSKPVTSSHNNNKNCPGQQTFQIQPNSTSLSTTIDPDTLIFDDGSVVKVPDGSLIVITDSSVLDTYEPGDLNRTSPLSQGIDDSLDLPVDFGPSYIPDPNGEFGSFDGECK